MPEIILHVPPRLWGLPSPSPFAVKAETYVRLAGLPYVATRANPVTAPRGKMPWMQLGDRVVPDSEAILAALRETFDDPLGDREVSEVDRQRVHLIRRTLENGTYWLSLYERWVNPANWPTTRAAFFDPLPFPVGLMVGTMLRRRVARDAWGQGVARYTEAERLGMFRADWTAVASWLGDGPFLTGETPRASDCMLYGFLAQVMWAPYVNEAVLEVRANERLRAYAERMRDRAWAEIPKLSKV